MTNSAPLKIVFAGTPVFAAIHLKSILDAQQHEVVAVYTQPDRPAGRGKKLTPSPVKQLALTHAIPVYQPINFKDPDTLKQLQAFNADLMVVVAYGLLLPKSVLHTPRLGCINVHASLLPRWRGAAPIQRAIAAGDKESGVVVMQMDEGLDTGDMLLQARCDISNTDTAASLHDKLADLGVDILTQSLLLLAKGQGIARAQDHSLRCYAHKIDKNDAIIDWHKPADEIERQVRAFNPFPVAYSLLATERIKIWSAEANSSESTLLPPPGTIIRADKKGIVVSCINSTLTLLRIQLPNKNALDVAAVLNAKANLFAVGNHFESFNQEITVASINER